MRKLAHYIRDHLSCCLNCGSLWITGQGLCIACLNKLKTKEKPKTFFAEDMKVTALFPWTPSESDLLSYWLLSLKGGGQQRIWKHWAYRLVAEKLNSVPRHCVVVPAPPSKRGEKDHAYEWAFAVSQALGADFAPCLKKTESRSQRRASLEGRLEVEFGILENSSGLDRVSSGTLWIFADDILTTGSTARAARKALGNPPHFETWVLAQRKLSCGASKHLL